MVRTICLLLITISLAVFGTPRKKVCVDAIVTLNFREALGHFSPKLQRVLKAEEHFRGDPLVRFISSKIAAGQGISKGTTIPGTDVELALGPIVQDGVLNIVVGHVKVKSDLNYGDRPEGMDPTFYKIVLGLLKGIEESLKNNSNIRAVEITPIIVGTPVLKERFAEYGFANVPPGSPNYLLRIDITSGVPK